MTTIVVEDGSNVTGSNSYVDVADVTTYVAGVGQNPATSHNWAAMGADQQGEAILVAAYYLDHMFRWYGLPYYPSRPTGGTPSPATQSMQWPRTKNYDSFGAVIPPGTIPREIKQAQTMLALEFVQDPNEGQSTIEDVTPVRDMAIGPIRMDFSLGAEKDGAITMYTGTRYPYIENLLKNLGTIRDLDELTIRKTDYTADYLQNPIP